MEYMLLIQASERRFATLGQKEMGANMEAYGTFTKELFQSGRAGDCAALEPTKSATTVRVRNDQRSVSDGPYAETREQLGGYYVVNVETPDEAYAIAAKIPDATGGAIEVRPVKNMVTPEQGSAAKSQAAVGKKPADATKEYLLLICEDEANWAKITPAEAGKIMGEYKAFSDESKTSGHFVAGAQLGPAAAGKAVRAKNGDRTVTDGPYAETREQLGGYYRVWARDLDEAIALAARIPAARTGCVEVRPVMDTSAYV